MYKKLTTLQQVSLLKTDDIIRKYPIYGVPLELLDAADKKRMDNYKIQSINPLNDVLYLVMTGESAGNCPSPVDVGRLYTKPQTIIDEEIWWV